MMFDDLLPPSFSLPLLNDRAIEEYVTPCHHCTHYVVTNSDNLYSHQWLRRMLQEDKGIVISHIITKNRVLESQ